MKPKSFPSIIPLARKWGYLWALGLVLLAFAMPRDGVWTIDDGVKLVGARFAQPSWHVILPNGPVRTALRDPAAYPPFRPPFAMREGNHLRLGFSPWTMALWGFLAKVGAVALTLLPALGSLAVWLLLRKWRGVAEEVIFFLPLTFYGLILWEHSIALALESAGLILLLRCNRSTTNSAVSLAAVLLGAGALLRPEMALLVPVIFIWLWRRDGIRRAALLILISTAVVIGSLLLSKIQGESLLPAQVLANFRVSGAASGSFLQALLERAQALWIFGLSMDANIWINLGLLIALVGGSLVIFIGEKNHKVSLLALGSAALLVWTIVVQFRLWTHPLPPVALLTRNSLLYAFPWVLLFCFYGAKAGKPFLQTGAVLGLLVFLTTPVFRGVHWGPRLLLPALPLLFIAYTHMKERIAKPRWLWRSLVALTLVQTLSSAALVYGRKVETAQRVQFMQYRIQSPLVVPSQSQAADLAPLWGKAEMFTAESPSTLRRFVADARRTGVQTFWLLLPQSEEEEPMKKISDSPMKLYEEYSFETGLFWKTHWWLGRFEDKGDSLSWGAFYDELARREIAREGFQRALPEHESATLFAPAQADYHYNYAVTLGRLGYFAEAASELRKAIAADSLHYEARELLEKVTASASAP